MNALPMETRLQTYKPTVRLLVLGVLLGRVQLFFQRKDTNRSYESMEELYRPFRKLREP